IYFSIAKSVTSTLVGAAIQDGKIKSLDDPVTLYIPELKGSGYDGVNLRQMLTMSSGVKWNEDYSDPNADVARSGTTYNEPGVNPIVSYMRRLPRAHEPGSTFHYNTGETHLVGMVVSKATGKSLANYASEKIWKPFGMERDAVWMLDAAGHELGGCCISLTVGDYARCGQSTLEGGKAGGPGGARAIVPDSWVAEAPGQRITGGALPQGIGYGYFWWVGSSGGFSALGIFGQSVTLFPADRLVIVVNSAWPRATDRDLSAGRSAFLFAVRDAAKGLCLEAGAPGPARIPCPTNQRVQIALHFDEMAGEALQRDVFGDVSESLPPRWDQERCWSCDRRAPSLRNRKPRNWRDVGFS